MQFFIKSGGWPVDGALIAFKNRLPVRLATQCIDPKRGLRSHIKNHFFHVMAWPSAKCIERDFEGICSRASKPNADYLQWHMHLLCCMNVRCGLK